MPTRHHFSFKAELNFILQCADFYAAEQTRYDELYPADRDDWDPADPDARIAAHKVWTARRFVGRPADRECLERMADHAGIDDSVAKIGVTSKIEARILIGEVLSARRLAEIATETPADAHRRHAKQAEDLARYLSGSAGGGPPPLPSLDGEVVRSFDDVARMLWEQAERSGLYVSPQDSDGSRARGTFMRIMGDWMQKAFGELFADQVGQLADLAFPRADCSATTAQNVYDARRQPQRKGTSRS